MRRWVCIVALLAGFSRQDYVRGARLPQIVPIERVLVSDGRRGLPTGAWWRLPT